MPKTTTARRAPATPAAAYTVKQFCEAHGISISHYYNMKRQGVGPREMRAGRKRRLISLEAAADWRAARERVA
jgi:hypothetical protein